MSQKDYDMVARWYVVHTYSGYENKVKTDLEKTIKNRELEDFFFDIIVPMEEQIEIKDGKRKTNLKKVFPGYVLIKMIVTEKTWYIVRNTRGVTGFVGSGTDPIPLTDEEIHILTMLMDDKKILRMSYGVLLDNKIHVTRGPLVNMDDYIIKYDKHNRLATLNLNFLNQIWKVGVTLIE